MRGRVFMVVAAVLALLVGGGASGSSSTTPRWEVLPAEATRIMVFGDSVAHGYAGDWTWRYRLDRWLVEQGLAVDMVGPYAGLHDEPPGQPVVEESMAYVDPAFDSDHASRWGAMLESPEVQVGDLVVEHQVDVLVLARGFNDIFYNSPVDVVEERVRQVVRDARSANPEVDVVLVAATQTWVRNVPELNDRLDDIQTSMDTPEARVVVAHADVDSIRSDTWDGSHATSVGEVKIAAAVADALAAIGVGEPYPRPLPEVPLGPRIPPVLTALPGDGTVSLSWVRSPGATSHRLWRHEVGTEEPEVLVAEVAGSAWLDTDVVNAVTYRYRVQPVKGTTAAQPDAWSVGQAATPLADVPGDAPLLWVASTAPNSVTLGWQDSLGVQDYLVWSRDVTLGEGGWSVQRVTGRSLELTGLRAGAVHEFSVAAVGLRAVGPRSRAVTTLVPGTAPALPGAVAVVDEWGTARIDWPAQPGVTSWNLRLHDPIAGWIDLTPVPGDQTSLLLPRLRAGESYRLDIHGWSDLVPGPIQAVVIDVPPIGPARWTRAVRGGPRRVRASVGVIAGADSYELAVARTRQCRKVPAPGRFRVRGAASPRMQRSVRVRSGALWVQWRGLRDGVPGLLGPRSYSCVEVTRRRPGAAQFDESRSRWTLPVVVTGKEPRKT